MTSAAPAFYHPAPRTQKFCSQCGHPLTREIPPTTRGSAICAALRRRKVALAYLVTYPRHWGVPWIDCQQETPHLASLGARAIARPRFLAAIAAGATRSPPPWGTRTPHARRHPAASGLTRVRQRWSSTPAP
ncbi:Leucyl/phenylalanyl-tRNA--protein transferase [Castellaniella defragrans]